MKIAVKKRYKWMIPVIWRNGKRLRFTDYRINREGVVKRVEGCRGVFAGTIIFSRVNEFGYVKIRLVLERGTLNIELSLHRLLYETFVGRIRYEINHKDCDRTNNSLSNLEDVSHSENMAHAVKNGAFKTKEFKEKAKRAWTFDRRKKLGKKLGLVNSGKHRSEETKEKIKKSLTGRKLSREVIENMRKAHLKFSEKEEDFILDEYKAGGVTHKILANKYGVAKSTICGTIYKANLRREKCA